MRHDAPSRPTLRRTRSAPAILGSRRDGAPVAAEALVAPEVDRPSLAPVPAPSVSWAEPSSSVESSFSDDESAAAVPGASSSSDAPVRSAGDQWAHEAAEKLHGKESDNPLLSGAVGAFTGRKDALERLPEEGLPRPRRVIEGVKRMAQVGGFVASGGLDEVSAGDVAGVGVAAARDTIENAAPIEAIKKAPEALGHAAHATQVASTITPDGRQEVHDAAKDLAVNKATEAGASVATGSGLAWGMRGAAAAIPPAGPWALGAKGALYAGSYAVQGAGLLHAAYTAQDFADKVDEHRDKSRHTGAAVDEVMARRGDGPEPEAPVSSAPSSSSSSSPEPAVEEEAPASGGGGFFSSFFGGWGSSSEPASEPAASASDEVDYASSPPASSSALPGVEEESPAVESAESAESAESGGGFFSRFFAGGGGSSYRHLDAEYGYDYSSDSSDDEDRDVADPEPEASPEPESSAPEPESESESESESDDQLDILDIDWTSNTGTF